MAAQRQLLVFSITPSFWVWVIYLLAAARADADDDNLSELLNGLVRRVVGEESYAQAWLGAVEWVEERGAEGKDSTQQYFNVGPSSKSTAAVRIGGSDRVALAAGFYHYLKKYANGIVTWGEDRTGIRIDDLPPKRPASTVRVRIPTKYRYYQNVCTLSYSMAFWDWKRWEKEIDWMALHGVNMPLAFVGQEYVWLKVYEEMGIAPEVVIRKYFSGPAFLAWNRMGNLRAWEVRYRLIG